MAKKNKKKNSASSCRKDGGREAPGTILEGRVQVNVGQDDESTLQLHAEKKWR